MKINFKVNEEEAKAILQVIGQLPTSSNAFPLYSTLVQQYQDQVKETAELPVEDAQVEKTTVAEMHTLKSN